MDTNSAERAGGESVPATLTASSEVKRESIPTNLRAMVFARDGLRCKKCGAADRLTADHVIPISAGGATTMDNLQTLCRPCNAAKGGIRKPYEPKEYQPFLLDDDAESIVALRRKAGLTQMQLATRLGVTVTTVSNWEQAKYDPNARQFRELARIFKVPCTTIALPSDKEDESS